MERPGATRSPLALAELNRRGLDEDVADRLRQEILKGDLAQGARLTELELAARWAVSQGTIRSALKSLMYEGVVEYRPRRGTFVATLTESDALEIYALRDALESLAARNAATLITDAGRLQLERVLRAMQTAAAAGNRKRMLELDFEFHRTIVEMSGNRRLLDTWLKLEVQTRLFLKMTDQFHHDLRNLVSIHEPIAEAVIAGNADQAFALASHHSEPDGTRLSKTIAATGDPKEETQKLRSSRG